MKWTYEEIACCIDTVAFAYIEDELSHEEKTEKEQTLFNLSGWTEDEFMTEMEKRLDTVFSRKD